MKRIALLAALTVFAGCGSDSPTTPTNGPIVFTAALSAANEVPPVTNADANGRGTATMTLTAPRDSSGAITGPGTMNFAVQLSGFPAGTVVRAAHIHPGAAGTNGNALVDTRLTPANPITLTDGTGTLTVNGIDVLQADAQAIVANPAGFYFNAHTTVNTGGAVRGQLVRQ
jgi:filamentous hemagglutinin family protein